MRARLAVSFRGCKHSVLNILIETSCISFIVPMATVYLGGYTPRDKETNHVTLASSEYVLT